MDSEILWRLLAAAGLAAVIGLEREVSGQPAGLRTHVTVAIGAGLFGVISTLGFAEFYSRRALTNVQVDVTRVASNVVVGIGFLGAGLIFRHGGNVKNLTTAASLWATAAVGLAAGVGNEGAAVIATAALLATLVLLRPISHLTSRLAVRERRQMRIRLVLGADPGDVIEALKGEPSVEHVELHKREGAAVIEVRLRGRRGTDLAGEYAMIAARPDVVDVVDPLSA
jgi:putative Mg2+ transporter-C (MgtC) family protein